MPDSERERATQAGPRGLGVALGFGVDDLESVHQYCVSSGCEITCAPMDEEWGERVFSFIDPFGYEWEPSQPISSTSVDEATAAVAQSWQPDVG